MRGWLALAIFGPVAFAQNSAADTLEAARRALTTGRYADAVKLYRQLSAAEPNNARIRLSLGLALEKDGHPAEAIPELERATGELSNYAPAWFLLGLAYQQLGKPKQAIAPLRKAVALDAANADALLELSDAELAGGFPREAVGGFSRLTALDPHFAKAWQGLCLSYIALGERALSRLHDTAPNSSFWHAITAAARAGQERYREALNHYELALRLPPAIPGLHAGRAEIYRKTNHPEWAATEEQRESQTPKPDCATRPTACEYLAGDWAKALAEAHKIPTPENLYWASLACDRLAEQSFGKLALLPPSPELHELMAESNQRMGRRLEAVEEWRKALAAKPGDRRLQGRLAESLERNRQYEEAESLLTPLASGQPENADWQYLLGRALLEQRRAGEALPHLTAASRLDPARLESLDALGRAYVALDQPAKAIPLLEKARPLDDGAISFALSAAYRRLGKESEARAALNRYRELTASGQKVVAPSEHDVIPAP